LGPEVRDQAVSEQLAGLAFSPGEMLLFGAERHQLRDDLAVLGHQHRLPVLHVPKVLGQLRLEILHARGLGHWLK